MLGNRYVLQNLLGEGGMGSVYHALDRLTAQTVALKRVRLSTKDTERTTDENANWLLSLTREFQTLASLRHPNIISVLDYGFDRDGQPYFTMQLLEHAQPLTTAGRDLSVLAKVNLLIETLHALAYLHRRGIIHRDLKPSNILVTDNHVRVLDFGLAGDRELDFGDLVVGTLAYMPPETVKGEPAEATSDLYAIGVIAYELFTAHHPFDGKTARELVAQILKAEPDLSRLRSALANQPTPPADAPIVPDSATVIGVSADDNPRTEVVTQPLSEGTKAVVATPGAHQASLLTHNGKVAVADIIGRLLRKNPGERYQDADQVITDFCAAIGQAAPPESVVIRESYLQAARFVGRDMELARLLETLNAALMGKGSAVLVGGESGVGKSRLVDELRIRTMIRGAVVLRGQGLAQGGLPYQLWRDVMRRLTLTTTLTDLEASVLKAVVPDIETLLGRPVADAEALDGKAAQQRLILTIVDVFKRQTQPVVLLLEDLQWAGESAEPLRALLPLTAGYPWLIVGTYRSDEAPELPSLFPGMHVLPLQRLSEAAIADLCVAMLGKAGHRPELVDLLRRETEGNAFFLVEMVRALAEESGSLNVVGNAVLPEHIITSGVLQIIRRRLSRVPVWATPALKLAAAIGRWLDLAALTQAGAVTNSEDWLTAGANAGVLDVVDGRWRFAHDKLRETLLADLGVEERRDLHRAAALALEMVYPDDENYYESLLGHWQIAGDLDKELHYLIRFGWLLADTRAEYDRALQLGQRGLDLIGETDTRRTEVLNILTQVCRRKNDYDAALGWAEKARASAEAHGDRSGIAMSLSRLGSVALDRGDYEAAQSFYEQSLAIRREIGEQRGIAGSLNNLGNTAFYRGEYAAAKNYFEKSLAIMTELGNRQGIAGALGNLGNVANAQREYAAAEDYLKRSLALLREVGGRSYIAYCLLNLGGVAEARGDFVVAEDYLQQSLVILRAIGEQQVVASNLNHLGFTMLAQEKPSRAGAYFTEALSIAFSIKATPDLVETLIGFARLRLRSNAAVYAAELSGLIEQHPALPGEVRDQKIPVLRRELEAVLPAGELAAARQRGAQMDFDAVMRLLLAES